MLTADHRSFCDGPLLAAWLQRPTLFAVHQDYGRHWFWSAVMRFWCRLWGHRWVVVSDAAPFGLRALLSADDQEVICVFPEGRIARDGVPYPWQPGTFFLLKHRADVEHWHLTINPLPDPSRWRLGPPGFDWTFRAVPVLEETQPPPSTRVPQGSGKGCVPNASGGNASTEMIS